MTRRTKLCAVRASSARSASSTARRPSARAIISRQLWPISSTPSFTSMRRGPSSRWMTARNRKQARCPRHSRLPCDGWMLTGIERVPVRIAVGEVDLHWERSTPAGALGVVLFAQGSGSSRFSPRNRHVAEVLNRARFATLLVDLLTSQEEAIDMRTARLRFDIGRLAERLIGSTDWLSGYPGTRGLSTAYFGASTGAGAALVAAPERTRSVAAIVSRGGRPDLAGPALPRVTAPTLLIVGGNDEPVIELNEQAMRQMRSETRLEIVPRATHLFEEPGALERVADLAARWFERHLRT